VESQGSPQSEDGGKHMNRRLLFLSAALLITVLIWRTPVCSESYFIWDDYGGTFHDANKNYIDDSLMCSVAASADVLAWGGWGADGIYGEDQIFQNFKDYWFNVSAFPELAWHWWCKGSLPEGYTESEFLESSGGGNHWPSINFYDYFHTSDDTPNLFPIIDEYLHNGYAVVASIVNLDVMLGHEVAVWGIEYHYDDTGIKIYDGYYFSDPDTRSTGKALEYEIFLYDSTEEYWYKPGDYFDWILAHVDALDRAPATATEFWSYDFTFEYEDGDSYTGRVYADVKMGYSCDLTIDYRDEREGIGYYIITDAALYSTGLSDALDGTVEILSYYDHESGITYDSDQIRGGFGTHYLGSEQGYIGEEAVPDQVAFFGAQSVGSPLYEADNILGRYDFRFEYDDGDAYYGYYFDSQDDAYLLTTTWDMETEVGPGIYIIHGSESSDEYSKYLQVFLTSYFDHESSVGHDIINIDQPLGTAGLESERGYICFDNEPVYRFGSWYDGFYEADVIYLYNFDCMFNNGTGDLYVGKFYSHSYYVFGGKYEYFTDENGQEGYYIIGPRVLTPVEESKVDQVFVDTYSDAESGACFLPVHHGSPLGWEGLGSEMDYIYFDGNPLYRFGTIDDTFYEADAYFSYQFTCNYDNGTGDWYSGTLYDHRSYDTSLPLYPFEDENDLPGYYTLSSMTLLPDNTRDGQVFVDRYYNAENATEYIPLHAGSPVGWEGLGSEIDYILWDGITTYRFGLNDAAPNPWTARFEADVFYRYSYRRNYNNGLGDFYMGTFFDHHLYEVGQQIYPYMDEHDLPGYYVVEARELVPNGDMDGRVYVNIYYDVEMKRAYVPTFSWGSEYLGSEYGYLNITKYKENYHPADDHPPGIKKFLFGNWGGILYEADVKQDKKKDKSTYPGLFTMNATNALVPYQPEEEEKTRSKKTK
jgi:hypothetical protein